MKHTTYSLHKIEKETQFTFNPSDYSQFKYGDDIIAQKFGSALAKGFIENFIQKIKPNEQLVVISSPYSHIPTATFAMKNHFANELNKWLALNDYLVLQETKIHRTITYKEDYGELDAEQRMSLIGNDSFHIDKEFVKGKTLIFLDDIRITGSHERMIKKMLQEYSLYNDSYLLYFAELVNFGIHPNIENYLNYFKVKSIYDLEPLIKSENFQINTRTVKYILNHDENIFSHFINNQTYHFKLLLLNMAIGNNYHSISVYQKNIKILLQLI